MKIARLPFFRHDVARSFEAVAGVFLLAIPGRNREEEQPKKKKSSLHGKNYKLRFTNYDLIFEFHFVAVENVEVEFVYVMLWLFVAYSPSELIPIMYILRSSRCN